MPTYEYKCDQCNKTFEVNKSISEASTVETCEKCGSVMVKQFGTFGIQFKGGGFYKTDNPK